MTRKEGESGGVRGDKKEVVRVEGEERNKEEKEHKKKFGLMGIGEPALR